MVRTAQQAESLSEQLSTTEYWAHLPKRVGCASTIPPKHAGAAYPCCCSHMPARSLCCGNTELHGKTEWLAWPRPLLEEGRVSGSGRGGSFLLQGLLTQVQNTWVPPRRTYLDRPSIASSRYRLINYLVNPASSHLIVDSSQCLALRLSLSCAVAQSGVRDTQVPCRRFFPRSTFGVHD